MPQKESCPLGYNEFQPEKSSTSSGIYLRSSQPGPVFDFTFEPVREGVFRTTFASDSHPIPPHPSVKQPGVDLGNVEPAASTVDESCKKIEVGNITASVEWSRTPVISLSWTGSDECLHRDLQNRSYVADAAGIAHYTVLDKHALHVGLGEKTAPMDLTGRHFVLSTTDCFGYDVYNTDPLYKHIPLLIKATSKGCVAMFSTSHSRGTWSVGSEIDGLWGRFKVYRQDYGGLEEYLIVGSTIKDVVRKYAELAGFPLLVPRWAYGYISGGYKYTMTDDPPAHQTLLDFADKLKEHDIPCSAHQMSSGYSIAEVEPKVRNVFTWNYHRFPNPEEWTAKYHVRGIRLLANIKPFVLKSHPDYQYLVDSGALFTNPETNEEGTMRLWSAGGGEGGDGCHLDFTSEAAFNWWYNGVKKLRRAGIDAMWNDNNEYTLPNDDWKMELGKVPTLGREGSTSAHNSVGLWGRIMHAELMGKASHDALRDLEPTKRPFVLTRGATAGTMRYSSSTWSGDNVTSWEGMKGANALSLTAGMSLLQSYGHDIGGFEGPQPSPELLLRWVQLGIYSPRFAINCFKTSPNNNSVGEVIEPWMYPEITPLIRDTIKRRYEILPYLYSLGLESHLTATPAQRWIGWGYESDPEVWSDKLKLGQEQYWLGDDVLVGGVYQPGVTVARIYLPRRSNDEGGFDYGYVNMNMPYDYHASGQWVDIPSEWKESIPLLARVGGVIPVGKDVQTQSPGEDDPVYSNLEKDDYRGVEIFPPRGSSHGRVFSSTWLEDDGVSLHPRISSFTFRYSSTEEKIAVGISRGDGDVYVPQWRDLHIISRHGDNRYVIDESGKPLERVGTNRGRAVYRLCAFERQIIT